MVGWYHSHPHITALPSHVDLGTQLNYQMLDVNFVGLIFSVFNHDAKTKSASEQVCCFQSANGQPRLIPFRVLSSAALFVLDEFVISDDGAAIDEITASKHAAVHRIAISSIASIFELYLKEEQEAYMTVEPPYEGDDNDSAASFGGTNFVRRVSNGAAFAAAIAKIVSVFFDGQMAAIQASNRISEARVAALIRYRDALKGQVESKSKVTDPKLIS